MKMPLALQPILLALELMLSLLLLVTMLTLSPLLLTVVLILSPLLTGIALLRDGWFRHRIMWLYRSLYLPFCRVCRYIRHQRCQLRGAV
jgi:hypothetical protein